MILQTREERARLLRSGFTGKQIEALYFVLNGFDIVGVDWDEAAAKCTRRTKISSLANVPQHTVHVIAAPSQGASA